MKHVGGYADPEIRRAYESGMTDGAAGRAADDGRYRAAGRAAAYLQGWHQGNRDRQAPAAGAVQVRPDNIHLAALRDKLAAARIDFSPGWYVDPVSGETHWHDRIGSRSACGSARHDWSSKPAEVMDRCRRCEEYLSTRDRVGRSVDESRREIIRRQIDAIWGQE